MAINKLKLLNRTAEEILSVFEDIGQGMIEFATTPYGKLRFSSIPRSTFYSSISSLEKKGFIEKKKKGRNMVLKITEKGRKILKKTAVKNRRSDSMSSIIIFDIPEQKSRARTIFRRYLQESGYTILQKSVLIAPFEVSKDIKQLINELEIRPYVSIIDGRVNYEF